MSVTLLKALCSRENSGLFQCIPMGMYDPAIWKMLEYIKLYYSTHPEHDTVRLDVLSDLIALRMYNRPEDAKVLQSILADLAEYNDPVSAQAVLEQLHELDLAGKAGAVLTQYNSGADVDIAAELLALVEAQQARGKQQDAPSSILDSIEAALAGLRDNSGLKWTSVLPLKNIMQGLRAGTNVGIGARVNQGKTAFILRTLADFAPQVPKEFGPDRSIIILSNEGSRDEIIPRLYQAVLKKSVPEVLELQSAGTLHTEFGKALGMNPELIFVEDAHGWNVQRISACIKRLKAAVVFTDMTANFEMPRNAQDPKTDAIEAIWQYFRQDAVRHNYVHFGAVQMSQDADGLMYPPMSALKDSKTGLQGALDVLIMLGSSLHPALAEERGLSTPKNKRALPGAQNYIREAVVFDAATSTFT